MNKSLYFTDVPKYGNLCIERILYEDEYPILFTLHCENDNHIKFICSCCDIRNEQRWVLTPIKTQDLIAFIENKITIHNMFSTSNEDSFIVRWKTGETNYKYTLINRNKLPEEDLPRQGFYLDAEENEFEDYQKELDNEVVQEVLKKYSPKHNVPVQSNVMGIYRSTIEIRPSGIGKFGRIALATRKTNYSSKKSSNAFGKKYKQKRT